MAARSPLHAEGWALLFALVLLGAGARPVAAGALLAEVEAGRDVTLVEHPDGDLSNSAGDGIFAGRTNQSSRSIRRALLWFDVGSALPADSEVEAVALRLRRTMTLDGAPSQLDLHRVVSDWGEGDSLPIKPAGGIGGPSSEGDATWKHRFYSDTDWESKGGDFAGDASAEGAMRDGNDYSWSTDAMGLDVQGWLDSPQDNFGWILIGDERTKVTAIRFGSREHSTAAFRPILEVTYTVPEPGQRLLGWSALIALGLWKRVAARRA